MEDETKSKRPTDSDFRQQRLKAWQPLLTPRWVIGTFLSVGLVFVIIGAVIIVESDSIVEVRARYDDVCGVADISNASTADCNLTLTIPEDMDAPIYFYYELSNYFQNHRRYVKSRDDEQLRGTLSRGVGDCDPIETNDAGDTIVACGLIANSVFNDTFTPQYCPQGGSCSPLTGTNWNKNGIAWQSDIDEKFKSSVPLPAGFSNIGVDGVPLPDVEDEDFIVWMRTAGLPTFKKLHRKIEGQSLKGGDQLFLQINNRYPVSDFDGEKHVVLSTTGWIGGKNDFLGWAYIAVGILCLLLGIAFLLKHVISPRKLGDMRYFQWSSAGAQSEES